MMIPLLFLLVAIDVPIGGMVGHPEGMEAFPCPTLQVPKIFDYSAARISNGTSFTETAYS
jgi:hypothetical protein